MDLTQYSMGFILSAIFVAVVILFGLFSLFVRAENIERTALVGGLTLATALIAMFLLWQDHRSLHPTGSAGLVSICLVSLIGYALGRFIDFMMGPKLHSDESQEGTLGADLAD